MGDDLTTYRSRIGVFPNRGQTRKRRRRRREGGKLTRYGQGLRKNISDFGLRTLKSILRTLTILGVGLVLHVHTMQALILSGDVETNPGPGSDNGKSIIWDDSKCVGESRSTPTSQKWLFRQEEDKRELKKREERDNKAEDETKKNQKKQDHEKNANKREAGFTSQDSSFERKSKEAEEESKGQEAEWMQPDSSGNIDGWSQGMFGVFGAARNEWEEAKQREKKKKEKEEKTRNKIEEEREKFSKLLKREKEENARKIKEAKEDKERAKQLDKPPSTSNNPESDHEVSQSRFGHPLLM